jgi:hypothetical protein
LFVLEGSGIFWADKTMPKVSADLRDLLVADRKSGLSVKAMAEKHGVNRTTVIKYTKATGELEARAAEFVQAPMASTATEPMPTVVTNFFRTLEAPQRVPDLPPPSPELPRGDPQELIQKIVMNAETFPDVFPRPPSQTELSSKSFLELQGILTTMEQSRAVKMLAAQMKQVFFVGSRATEMLGKSVLRLRVDGMTDALMAQQAELDYLFRELAIKHAPRVGPSTSPEARLLMIVGLTMLQTDATNRLRERTAKTTNVETTEKYADL